MALLCVMFYCVFGNFPHGVLGQVWYLIVSIPDICQGLPVAFFCSGIQFYLMLSPYLCFISFLHPDLYALGDDALIS